MKKSFVLLLVPALALAIYDMKWFDLNHWRAPFYNDGRWGIDITQGSAGAGTWPQPLHNVYVFGAGPWVGAIVGNETLVTIGYNPNSGGTEFIPVLCRYWRQGSADSADRVYKYPGDWPPPLSRFPMAPQVPRSPMELWACFGDSDPTNHISPGRPLGIDIYLTVFGFSDSIARDIFFLKYELANFSGASLNQAYFGMMLDGDIGDFSDDMTGLILNKRFQVGSDTFWVRNTGYLYDWDNYEPPSPDWDSGTPGAVALRLLAAPPGLGLTAFKKLTIDIDPVTDPDQFLTLAGYNYLTGQYQPYDSVDLTPGDKRALLACGPFTLQPDSVATFWFAVIGAPYGEANQPPNERDTTELALRCWWAEQVFPRLLAVAEGRQPTANSSQPPATIVRGVLFLPAVSACLLDASGRKVMDLSPGPNDMHHIAPGAYFVVNAHRRVGRGWTSSVRKVILTN
ncbi:MAG: hypothetical protein ABIK44_05465 [candidate division WOR-3 bacterium]